MSQQNKLVGEQDKKMESGKIFSRAARINVQNDTINAFNKLQYTNSKNQVVNIPKQLVTDCVESTQYCDNKYIH